MWVYGLALEGGYRLGRWRHDRPAEEKETPVGAMVGSILGLLAFLLAFTFGMAATRFEARRQAVLDEANAIGTTYLRARLLPEPQRTESAKLLREYVDVRISGSRKTRWRDHHPLGGTARQALGGGRPGGGRSPGVRLPACTSSR